MGLTELLPLPVISAFIRLGTKYGIRKLRIEGQRRIFDQAPVDLANLSTNADDKPTWTFVAEPEHWFDLVAFARTTKLLSVLPYAFYHLCAHFRASEITGGWTQKDGTIVSLSVPDQLACLEGFQAICAAQAETTFSWAYKKETSAGCTGKRCSLGRLEYLAQHFTGLPTIQGLDRFQKLKLRNSGLCSGCADRAEGMHNAGRKAFWAMLPRFFGLPPWEELRKEREELYVLISFIYKCFLTMYPITQSKMIVLGYSVTYIYTVHRNSRKLKLLTM